MFTKLTTIAALVVGLTASTAVYAGGNSTANQPSTPSVAAIIAGYNGRGGRTQLSTMTSVTRNSDGTYSVVTSDGLSFTMGPSVARFFASLDN